MNNPLCILVLILSVFIVPGAHAETLSCAQFLDRIRASHSSPRIAALEVMRSREALARTESRLDWRLNASASVAREAGLFGGTVDSLRGKVGATRRFEDGIELSVTGSHAHEDASLGVSPTIPNPNETLRADVAARAPLLRGQGDPAYRLALTEARLAEVNAMAAARAVEDRLSEEASGLYYQAAEVAAARNSARDSLARTHKLQSVVSSRLRMGLSEEKDRLVVESQLRAREAEMARIETDWSRLAVEMNRLLRRPVATPIELAAMRADPLPGAAPDDVATALLPMAERHRPALARARAELDRAEMAVTLARDDLRDRFDLTATFGALSKRGEVAGGTTHDDATVGGIAIEFARPLTRRGEQAALTEALIARDIAQARYQEARDEVRYDLSGTVATWRAGDAARLRAAASEAAERARHEEAGRRYRAGRTDAERLIEVENDLARAQYTREVAEIAQARRRTAIDILAGIGVTVP